MGHQIETVTDKERFPEILDTHYKGSRVIVKLSNGNAIAEYAGRSESTVAFKVHNVKNLPKECLFISRDNYRFICGTMKQIEQQEDQLFIFTPEKFQIISSERREQRLSTGGEGKQIIFITNIMSNMLLSNDMILEKKKIDKIREHIEDGLDKAYENIRVYFISDRMLDARMKFFLTNPKPIFIPDIKEEASAEDADIYRNYINNIYSADYIFKNSKISSEISIPFLYQMKMPYGYIQINSLNKLDKNIFKNLKQYSAGVARIFDQNRIFKPSMDRFLVADVSKNGFGIAFRDRKLLRQFKENTNVTLDMRLPESSRASIYATVRHITIRETKIISVGFEIIEMDAIGETAYEDFLNSIT